MRSTEINWPASNTTVLGSAQTYTNGVALTWNPTANLTALYTGINYVTNAFTGTTQSYVNMPPNTHRTLSLTSASNLSGTSFQITGYTQTPNNLSDSSGSALYQTLVTENLAGPNATTVYSTNTWISIVSIIPNATSASTVSVGYGLVGRTTILVLDIWNKNAITTLQYTSTQLTGLSLIPAYTAQNIWTYPAGIPTFNVNVPEMSYLNLANPSIVLGIASTTPPPTTLPITTPMTVSISNLAMTGICTIVNMSYPFTQTIVQEGGRF